MRVGFDTYLADCAPPLMTLQYNCLAPQIFGHEHQPVLDSLSDVILLSIPE